MKIVIIEDESRTAKELASMLNNLDNSLEIKAIIPSVAAGLKWFSENEKPDLIFSDIQLGDGLSFEIFTEVQIQTPIIFCTAFDKYAIRAFESNSVDYLLKPIEEETLAKSLDKFNRFKEHLILNAAGHRRIAAALSREPDPKFKQRLLVHYQDKIIPVKTMDIRFIYATGGSTVLYTDSENSYPIQYTIEQLEKLLDPDQFFRANRQFIINRDAVKNIEHYSNRKLHIQTEQQPPENIVVSKLKASAFLNWIEQ